MARAAMVATGNRTAAYASAEAQTFEVLRELTRNGYVPDTSDIETSGILLRHDQAPDLVLHADGRIDVPIGQRRKAAMTRLIPNVSTGMSWRRTAVIVFLGALLWSFALFLTVSFMEM
jgi:hypothetical protein